MMNIQEKSERILPLFEQLLTLTKQQLPAEDRDPRLVRFGIVPRGTLFVYFNEKHLQEATDLFEVLYAASDFEDFIKLTTEARQVVNEGLFVFVLSVCVANRDDCRSIKLPPIQEIFPDRFIPVETLNFASKEARNRPNEDIVVEIQKTGNIKEPEYRLAYFREDIGINAHHWYWHIMYPANWNEQLTGKMKDRKGELFYYSHQQMCARYDCERLSNGMNRVIPFHNFDEKLEGYAPHLTSVISGLNYASRPHGLSLKDLPDVYIQDLERWRERIIEAIDLKRIVKADGTEIPLDEERGTDILGAVLEASSASPNRAFYGSLQYWGHVMIANVQDPDNRFHENPNVMSDSSTALRDPLFYRWHRLMDKIIQHYKTTLKPYTKEQLSFEGIIVVSTQINAKKSNVLTTFMKEDYLDISHFIKYGKRQKVSVKYQHLDHEPFSLVINVENSTGSVKNATFRVFLGPKRDELGNRLCLDEQRRVMIELDKFRKELIPGKNVINRASSDSSVTLFHTYTFDELKAGENLVDNSLDYSGCGWPLHLLIPKGNFQGMDFELFVMCTDYASDNPKGNNKADISADAVSYCGVKDQQYPDKKSMGFPFDRPIPTSTAAEFLTKNMSLTDVKIKSMD